MPGPPTDDATTSAIEVLARLIIVLAVAGLLSADHLSDWAASQPFGSRRDALVSATRLLQEETDRFGLNEPQRLIDSALGRGETSPGSQLLAPTVTTGPGTTGPGTPPSITQPATAQPSASEPATTSSTSTSEPTTTTSATTSTTTPTTLRPVDENQRLRLWAGGDSLGEYVGNQLLHPLADPVFTDVELDFQISTGLTRPDYFDWPGHLREIMAQEAAPEALIFMVGGNDNQDMIRDDIVLGYGSPEWAHEYRRRVTEVMDLGDNGASHLYWIGLPPMRDPDRDQGARAINKILWQEAALRPWVSAIDITEMFGAQGDGGFVSSVAAPTGEQRVARAPDGVHITFVGSTWIAEDLWADIGQRWNLPDPSGAEG